LVKTEIIGLLGGRFYESEKQLHISVALPCNSLSTGIQCEMDPLSEMKAREILEHMQLEVVGWYHSHPTFAPSPSLRDIENQSNYQMLFAKKTGQEPFIGIIVSPYDIRHPGDESTYSYVFINNQEYDENHEYKLPYQLPRDILRSETLPSSLLQQVTELIKKYKFSATFVDFKAAFRGGETTSNLDKLINSLASNIFVGEDEQKKFLSHLKSLLLC